MLAFGVSFGVLARAAGMGAPSGAAAASTCHGCSARASPVAGLTTALGVVADDQLGDPERLERLAGLAAAAVALQLRAPLLLAIVAAAAVTAALRAL